MALARPLRVIIVNRIVALSDLRRFRMDRDTSDEFILRENLSRKTFEYAQNSSNRRRGSATHEEKENVRECFDTFWKTLS